MQTLTLEDGRPSLVVTDLAENKVYMKFSNWWDQIVLHGALPFLILAVSNIRSVLETVTITTHIMHFVTIVQRTCIEFLDIYLLIFV